MSDAPENERWWRASDGKWYPPEQHPNYVPPPPAPAPAVYPPSNPPDWSSSSAIPAPTSSYGTPSNYGEQYGYSPYPTTGAQGYGAPPANRVGPANGVFLDRVLQLPLAPWWKRLVAILIDGVVFGFCYLVILIVIGALVPRSTTASGATQSHVAGLAGFIFLLIVFSIPAAVYYGAMNGSRRGQTLGKMALSIAVRDAKTGTAIGFWRGAGRFLITMVFTIAFYIPYIIDSLSPLWDGRRQSWHDKVAHTVVVDLKP
jgi:uncharacterized RDD family membrane protein YckC